MIELYTGDFMVNPIPLQLSLNYCSHACSYCSYEDEPITLASLRTKRAGDIAVGDKLLGWARGEDEGMDVGKRGLVDAHYRKWAVTEVTNVFHRKAKVVKVTTADGRSVICTPDHHWYTGRSGDLEYKPASTRNGRKMYRLRFEGMAHTDPGPDYMTGYIRAVFAGDGTWTPQGAWRLAMKDLEPMQRVARYLRELGMGSPDFKQYGKDMWQMYFQKADPVNVFVNDLDIDTREYWRGWLAGIYDAEGNTQARLSRKNPGALRISQYQDKNPLTYDKIKRALRLFGFGYISEKDAVRMFGGRLESVRFVQLVQPAIERKANPLIGSSFKGIVEAHQIVSVEDAGEAMVASFTTTTHNYVSGGYLSRNCFANLNAPNRKARTKQLQSQLKNFHGQDNLVAHLMREKYPVLISNLVDPFATSNYGITVPVSEQLVDLGIPIHYQTRGGRGVDDVLSFLPPSLWYVSITGLDDEVRKKYEPAAPSIQSRLDLVEKLITKGHKVVVGANPLDFIPDPKAFVKRLNELGVFHFWIATIHLSSEQQANMKPWMKEALGKDFLQEVRTRAMTDRERSLLQGFKDAAVELSEGNHVYGYDPYGANDFFDIYRGAYPKTFPVTYEWINELVKGEDRVVTFAEYRDFFAHQLPQGDFHMPGYIFNLDRAVYKKNPGLKKRMTFSDLLGYYWNIESLKRTPQRYQAFTRLAKVDAVGNPVPSMDSDGNAMYWFSKEPSEYQYMQER